MTVVSTDRSLLGRLLERLAALVPAQDEAAEHPPRSETRTVRELRTRMLRLEREAEKSNRARNQATERHARMREKFEERRKTAADRWREIQQLRRENTKLQRDLARATKASTGPRAPLPARSTGSARLVSARKIR